MDPALLVEQARQALWLAVALGLPAVGVAALVGAFVAALQAATQIQDPTLAHLPRLLAVAAVLAVLGPRMGRELSTFTERTFTLAHGPSRAP